MWSNVYQVGSNWIKLDQIGDQIGSKLCQIGCKKHDMVSTIVTWSWQRWHGLEKQYTVFSHIVSSLEFFLSILV